MFDPFFPLLLIGAPVPLLMLIVYELRRRDRSFTPKGTSIGLAMVSAGGLWVLLIFGNFKDGISEDAFGQLVRHELWPATACVIGCYCLLSAVRGWRKHER
jgi:hypothetical protein